MASRRPTPSISTGSPRPCADLRAQIGPLARAGPEPRARCGDGSTWSAQRAIFGDTPRNRLLFDAYWLTPMTMNTYMEARGEPIVQGDESLYPDN